MALKDWKPRKWTKLFMSRQLRKETPPYYQNLKIDETIEVYRMQSRWKEHCKTWVVNITKHNTKKFGSKRAALKYVKSYMTKNPKKVEDKKFRVAYYNFGSHTLSKPFTKLDIKKDEKGKEFVKEFCSENIYLNSNKNKIVQSTGLKDKTKTEIFEGHIVELNCGCTGQIKLRNGKPDCYIARKKLREHFMCSKEGIIENNWKSSCEIIGNIYDNLRRRIGKKRLDKIKKYKHILPNKVIFVKDLCSYNIVLVKKVLSVKINGYCPWTKWFDRIVVEGVVVKYDNTDYQVGGKVAYEGTYALDVESPNKIKFLKLRKLK